MEQHTTRDKRTLSFPCGVTYRGRDTRGGSVKQEIPLKECFKDGIVPSGLTGRVFVIRSTEPEHPRIDIWKLRELLLNTAPGKWQSFVEAAADFENPITCQDEFQEWQDIFRRAALRPPDEWRSLRTRDTRKVNRLPQGFYLKLKYSPRGYEGVFEPDDWVEAIGLTLHLDKIHGMKFKACPVCGQLFRFAASRRNRRFCSRAHAHKAAVQAHRLRQADKKRKAKRVNSKRKVEKP